MREFDPGWTSAVQKAMAKAQNDGSEDFKLFCGDRSWNVHTYILQMHSDVLGRMCTPDFLGRMYTADFEGKELKYLDLHEYDREEDADCVEAMINYFYTSEYKQTDVPSCSLAILHCKTFIMADKYKVENLKSLARIQFERSLRHALEDSDGHWAVLTAARFAWEAHSVTLPLRSTILSTFFEHAIIEKSWEDVQELMRDPTFACELVQLLQDRHIRDEQSKVTYVCNSCNMPLQIVKPDCIQGTILCICGRGGFVRNN